MSSDDKNAIRPRIRTDRLYEFRSYFESFVKAYTPELVTTCLTCVHFDEGREACKISNGMRPPARVIAYGCGKYFSPDEIPF